jgi:hypothetical protein
MASINNITPGTPATKLSWLTTNIHSLLRELNAPIDSQDSFSHVNSASTQHDCLFDIIQHFQEQQHMINDMLNNTASATSSNPTLPLTSHSPTMPEYYDNVKYEGNFLQAYQTFIRWQSWKPFIFSKLIRHMSTRWGMVPHHLPQHHEPYLQCNKTFC